MQSGITDQYIYFVAVDATDYVTRETGLSTWTVYRSRNGAAAVAYTTPTISEISAANMPGVYALLLDEDMTIDAGDDSQEIVYHITHAGMAPVTRTIELYRPIVTAGQTITVANGAADADLERIQGTVVNTPSVAGILEVDVTHFNGTAGTFASGRPEVNMSHIAGAAVSTTTAQIGVNAVQISGDATAADNAELFFDGTGYNAANSTVGTVTTTTTATNVTTVNGLAANVITAASMAADASAEIADAVWDEDATAHQTQGTFGQAIGDPGADTDTIWALVNTNLDATVSSRASQTSLDTLDDYVDTEVAAIKTKTDFLPSANAGAAGGLLIAGSNAATTFATLTVTGATTLTGNVACAAGITITQSTVNGHGISITGNGTGDGVHIVGGATSGNGIYAEGVGIGAGAWLHGGSDSGTSGLYCDASGDGHGIYSQGSGAGNGMYVLSDVLGTGNAVAFSSANGTGDGLDITGEIGLDLNGTGGDHISPSAASQIADYVWDEATAGHTTAGTTGKALTDAGSAGDPWSTALPGAYGAGTAGKILGDNLNATVSSRASQTSVDTIDDFLDTEIAAIITTLGTPAGASISADILQVKNYVDDIGVAGAGLTAIPWNAAWDAEVQSEVNDGLIAYDAATGSDVPSAATIADAVWDEALAGHAGVGSTGAALSAAGSAGDPWSTVLPGAYGAGTAGKIIGDNINATISSRATQASVDTVDTVVDAIKAKTDNLTFTVAGQVDANAESMNGTEILGNGSSGDLWRG